MWKQLHGGWLPRSMCHFSHCVEYPHACSVSHPEQRLRALICIASWPALTLIYDKPVNIKGIFRKRTYIEIWGTSPLWLSINNFLNEFLSVNGSQSPGEIGSVQILTLWSKENDRAKMTNWAARTLGGGDVWGEESEFLSLLTTSVDSTANLCQLGVRTC